MNALSFKNTVSKCFRILILFLLTTAATTTLRSQSKIKYGLEGGYTNDKVIAKVMELDDTEIANTFNYRGFYAGGSLSLPFFQTGLLFRYQSSVGNENPSHLVQYVPDKQMFLEVPITTNIGFPIVNFNNSAFIMLSVRLGVMPSLNLSDITGYEALNKFDLKLLGGLFLGSTDLETCNVELYYMLRRGLLDLDKNDVVNTHTNGGCIGMSIVVNVSNMR